MPNPYDILIIGGGPGGYVAAIRAAQLGFKTAVVEREHLGGICLNWGCIPTKALLRTAEIFHYAEHAKDYGLKLEGKITYDPAAVVKRSRAVSGQLNGGVGFLMKKNKIDVIWGEATITKPGEVSVGKPKKQPMQPQHPAPKGTLGEGTYQAKHIIIATGARPRVLPGIEPDGKLIWTYFRGDGAAGIPEVARRHGIGCDRHRVRLVLSHDGLRGDRGGVTAADPARRRRGDRRTRAQALREAGDQIHTDTKVTKVEKGANDVTCTLQDGKGKTSTLKAERVISAVGVVGNTENLGLEKLGVKIDRGVIVIDEIGRTNVPGIYAIGDVAGPPMLAHKAEHEGTICVEAIKGLHPHAMDKLMIPGCTYCQPQVASVGLTEAKAKEQGYQLKIGRFPFIGNGKAIALGEPDGLVKTIFDAKTGKLLGAHMVGAEVTELIQGFVIAMNLETTEEELINSVFPHPTLSEMMHESVLDAYGRVIHT